MVVDEDDPKGSAGHDQAIFAEQAGPTQIMGPAREGTIVPMAGVALAVASMPSLSGTTSNCRTHAQPSSRRSSLCPRA
jgi:hypothetical protein